MSKNLFVGVDGKARKAKKFYVGVNGKARKIVKAYIGDENGKARPFWEKETTPAANSLEFVSDNSFTMSAAKLWDGTLSYNNGNGNGWTIWDGSEISSNAIDGRQRIYFRGSRNTVIRGNNASYSNPWKITGSNIECNGNIECLLDYQKVAAGEHPEIGEKCYMYMFYNCSSLTTAPQLPATTLAKYCYHSMFNGCSSLTTAPELPATILAYYCYSYMFYGCSSLTTTPQLPATTLAEGCYMYMFCGCSKFTTAPELPATTLAQDCYSYMFNGCSSFTTAPALPATTLAKGCYSGMFSGCSSLTAAPELPATTLAEDCYASMFLTCSFTTAPQLPATTLAKGCYRNMFNYMTELVIPPVLPATTLAESCYEGMFAQCYIINPLALPATVLANNCYKDMFRNTWIELSSTQSEEYPTAYRVPITGEGTDATDALSNMFTANGDLFTGTPTINTTYYLHKDYSIIS